MFKNRITVIQKISLVLMVPTIGALLAAGLFYSYLIQTAHDGAFINIAGQQRMLSEQLRSYASMVSRGHEADRSELNNLIHQFDHALNTLETGGTISGYTLPPVAQEFSKEFIASKAIWLQVKTNLLLIASKSVNDAVVMQAFLDVEPAFVKLSEETNYLVTRYEQRSTRLRNKLLGTLLLIVTLDFMLLLAGVRITRHYVAERRSAADARDAQVKRLQKLSELSMTLSGKPAEVFQQIAQMIGELLDMRVVCLSEIRGGDLHFISVYVNGEVVTDAGQCSLEVTPCATVNEDKEMRIYDHVTDRFPQASFLKAHNAFSYCGFPALDSQGNVIAVTCLLDDKPHEISDDDKAMLNILGKRIGEELERKQQQDKSQQTEIALNHSNDRFRNLVETINDLAWEIDKSGAFTYVGPHSIDLLGYDPDEMIGKTPYDFMPPDEAERVAGIFEHILENRESFTALENINTHKNGTLVTLETSGRPVFDADNNFLGYRGIDRDINERKRMEDMLRKLAEGVSGETGEEFFNALVQQLTQVLNVKYAYVAILADDDAGKVESIAICSNGRIVEDFEIDINGTPCQNVIEKGFCHYPDNIQQLFPDDAMLVEMGAESYFGTPLFDQSGKTMGLLAILDVKPLTNVAIFKSIFQLYAVRAATELERMRVEEHLQYMAHYDALTGLPNRSLFIDRLHQSLAWANRHKKSVAVLFLDLDRFKVINDTLGHDIGDMLLQSVSERLLGCVREEDTVARHGGDEFILLLSELTHEQDAALVADKINCAILKPFMLDGRELFITTSIGISLYPTDGSDAKTLVKNADIAMYRAKEQGRNNYQLYTAAMNEMALERLSMENSLRHALNRNEFLLYYQPKIDLKTGEMTGVEALLRWQHPEYGMISPVDFIPLLEETGLIAEVGKWVLHKAVKEAKQIQNDGLRPQRIAVNISARQFKDQDFAYVVFQSLENTGLDPQWLELEITESILMDNEEQAISTLAELNEMGVHLTIDDFGTGYSSLSYLKRFPIHTLKIDRSFIKDVTTDSDDAAIAMAIIAMAHSMKLTVVAEGVEIKEQIEFLCEHQCDEMQGFYFSGAVPIDVLSDMIKKEFHLSHHCLLQSKPPQSAAK